MMNKRSYDTNTTSKGTKP